MNTSIDAGQTATDLTALVAGDRFVLSGGEGYFYEVLAPARHVIRKDREGLTIRVALNGGTRTKTLHMERCPWGYDTVMVLPA